MRNKRAGALIIRDKKILLVSNDEVDVYWTPGGRLEGNESYEEALRRELLEEVGVKIQDFRFFRDTTHDYKIKVAAKYFLVDIMGEPSPQIDEATKFGWFTKSDIVNKKVKVTPYFTEYIFPELQKEGLI